MDAKEVEVSFLHKQLLSLDKEIKSAFKTVYEEFEDHLDAINENTQELQGQYDSLSELNRKIEKLNDRIDQLQMLMRQIYSEKRDIPLTFDEQKVFLLLYTHESGFISFDELMKKTNFTPDYMRGVISSMLDKGVSMIREIIDGGLFFKLNPYFRAQQTKENLVKIDPSVVRQFENKLLGSYF